MPAYQIRYTDRATGQIKGSDFVDVPASAFPEYGYEALDRFVSETEPIRSAEEFDFKVLQRWNGWTIYNTATLDEEEACS